MEEMGEKTTVPLGRGYESWRVLASTLKPLLH